jgi:hypothetical protein
MIETNTLGKGNLLVREVVPQIERDETKQEKSGKLLQKSGKICPVP